MDSLSSVRTRLVPVSAISINTTRDSRCAFIQNSSIFSVSAHVSSFSSGSLSQPPKSYSSSSSRCHERRLKWSPSAVLNAAEYRKQNPEKGEGSGGESDDDLCPVECVREIKNLRELESALHESKSDGSLVVVDFFRTSCGSCRYIEKGFIKLCKGAGNGEASVVFLKHNVMDEYEEQSDVADKFRIKVVPLFHFYKDGELVESFPTRDKTKILETIYKYLGVDQTIEEWSDLYGLK